MNEKLTKLRRDLHRDLHRELTEGLGRDILKGVRGLLVKNPRTSRRPTRWTNGHGSTKR